MLALRRALGLAAVALATLDTNAVRIGDALSFVFLTSENRVNVEPGRVFVRRLDLRTHALGPPVRVFDLFQPGGNNHHLPSLARDAGALWVILPFQDLACVEDPRRPPPPTSCGLAAARRIADLDDPRSFGPDRRSLPMRMRNTFGFSHLHSAPAFAGLRMVDWISVYDPLSGTGYAVGQLLAAEIDDRPGQTGRFDDLPYGGGFPAALVRFLPGGRVDGPYMITGTEVRYPGEPVGECNLMSKPMLRLGRPVGAQRRLHLLWVARCQLIGKPLVSYWDPAYAWSDDGGRSLRTSRATRCGASPSASPGTIPRFGSTRATTRARPRGAFGSATTTPCTTSCSVWIRPSAASRCGGTRATPGACTPSPRAGARSTSCTGAAAPETAAVRSATGWRESPARAISSPSPPTGRSSRFSSGRCATARDRRLFYVRFDLRER